MAGVEGLDFHVVNIMLSSIDGKIAYHGSESTTERRRNNFVCEEDFIRLRTAIARCNAVFVGSGTIHSESGGISVADLRQDHQEPEWFVFTQNQNYNFSSRFWQQSKFVKHLVRVSSFNVSEKPFLETEHSPLADVVYYVANIAGLLQQLTVRGLKTFALLGGGKLNAAFWEQDLVNELLLTVSPIIVGDAQAPSLVTSSHLIAKRLVCKKISQVNDFIFIDYVREK